jgi:Nucleotidyl transferase AbiEii toxin, Type IV TA system
MTYPNGAAFRRALEDRLRNQSLQTHVPLVRLRKLVAFDRLLARLVAEAPENWLLKGGLALQLRLGQRSRTTQDIDLLLVRPLSNLRQALTRAAAIDLRDWFEFEVAPLAPPTAPGGGTRFLVISRLDSRAFERFHVDIGIGDPVLEPAESIATPPLLVFAGLLPTQVRCYPLTQQIAEKLHAYTRPRQHGDNSRVKDLVDFLLMAELGVPSGDRLLEAVAATFAARQTHMLPFELPLPPSAWEASFRQQAEELELGYTNLWDAFRAASAFLNPVLQQVVKGKSWHSVAWEWR